MIPLISIIFGTGNTLFVVKKMYDGNYPKICITASTVLDVFFV